MFLFLDTDYTDNAAVLVLKEDDLPAVRSRFQAQAATVGLRPSWRKTKIRNVGAGDHPHSLRFETKLLMLLS